VRPEDADVAWPSGGAELAALRAKAVEWLARAAEGAMSRYELVDAAALLRRALMLEDDRHEQLRLWRRLGRVHALHRDGDSFMNAMERALELAEDPRERAETYAELAFEGALRSGMWRRRPARAEMESWTTEALAGVQYGSAPHVKVLLCRAVWGFPGSEQEANLAAELADQIEEALDEHVVDLTPHHRLHGVSCKLEVEELAGNWHAVTALEAQTEQAVDQNRDTPCVRNARSLLLLAFASELAGHTDRARELEQRAEELQNEGYGATLATPRARMALARGEFDRLQELLADEEWMQRETWFSLPAGATRLDALAVLGSRAEVEETAGRVGRPGSYLEPFALRARGVVDEDEVLLDRADELFRPRHRLVRRPDRVSAPLAEPRRRLAA
jgi:hypothetical protein